MKSLARYVLFSFFILNIGTQAFANWTNFCASVDQHVVYKLTGKHYLCSSRTHDSFLIEKINRYINSKILEVPSYFEAAFKDSNIVERQAAHSLMIRIFIHNTNIPAETGALLGSLNADQKEVGLAYLSAIDQGSSFASQKYGLQYSRIKGFAEAFIFEADQAEIAFHQLNNQSLPVHFTPGNRVRPLDPRQEINLGPKVVRHAVTSLMLGEFRRSLYPKAQQSVDFHFHGLNQISRPELIKEMQEGPYSKVKFDRGKIFKFEKRVQIEFYPDKTLTDLESFHGNIQGAGTLTTEGLVSKYIFDNGNIAYLIKYLNYKTVPKSYKYLVSDSIPVGRKGETYYPELDIEEAHMHIFDFSM